MPRSTLGDRNLALTGDVPEDATDIMLVEQDGEREARLALSDLVSLIQWQLFLMRLRRVT